MKWVKFLKWRHENRHQQHFVTFLISSIELKVMDFVDKKGILTLNFKKVFLLRSRMNECHGVIEIIALSAATKLLQFHLRIAWSMNLCTFPHVSHHFMCVTKTPTQLCQGDLPAAWVGCDHKKCDCCADLLDCKNTIFISLIIMIADRHCKK